MPSRLTRKERYLMKVDERGPDECWPWLAGTNEYGYGTFRGDNGEQLAHRFGFILMNGPIPQGMCVCHSCDNPPCQNPRHWFLGTHADNMTDMMLKGRRKGIPAHSRGGGTPRAGEGHPHAKLTGAVVQDICSRYAAGETQAELATRHGVTQSAVGRVLRGKAWVAVTGGTSRSDPRRRSRGPAHFRAKLTAAQAQEIRERYASGGISQASLAKEFGVAQPNISRIVRGVGY